MAASRRTRVAVLGGGPAALTAAFELTATPELRERYEVTVHQLGWRLGGKGASGRNAARGQRIEEHGLHIWFGFYDNAFSLIRRCYSELGRPPDAPLATWTDAFKPRDDCVQFERFRDEWVPHSFTMPRNPLTPGDPHEAGFWELVRRTIDFLERELRRLHEEHADAFAAAAAKGAPKVDHGHLHRIADRLQVELESLETASSLRLLQLANRLSARHAGESDGGGHAGSLQTAAHLLGAVRDWVWRHVVAERVEHKGLRLFFMWLDLGAAMLDGIADDRLRARGFGAINHEEFRAWLRRHGASELTVDASPLVRAIYDAAFCYEDGDVARPNVAAGKAAQDLIRSVLLYKGALMYKMQAGMGDAVFSPMYEVLQRRGVRFEFFHCVTHLGVAPDGRAIDRVELVEQARVKGAGYAPLVEVKGLPCWPSEPDWTQLEQGAALRERGVDFERDPNPLGREPLALQRGEDFDVVVLGIPVGALPPLCDGLAAVNPRFRQMIEHSHSVMTQAFQLWLSKEAAGLGWMHRPGTLASCYVEPLDTYCDMSHLIPREDWAPEEVRHIAYFCGVLPSRGVATQEDADARARQSAIEFLRRDVGLLWPAAEGDDFDWSLLVAGNGGDGEPRFDSQYWRGNFSGSERYALTLAGSVEYRLWPEESGFENLFLAGDWTRNGIDGGSVEAAVASGLLAARAITGDKTPVPGTGGWLESDRGDARV